MSDCNASLSGLTSYPFTLCNTTSTAGLITPILSPIKTSTKISWLQHRESGGDSRNVGANARMYSWSCPKDQKESNYGHADKTPVTKSARAEGKKDAREGLQKYVTIRVRATHTISSTMEPARGRRSIWGKQSQSARSRRVLKRAVVKHKIFQHKWTP